MIRRSCCARTTPRSSMSRVWPGPAGELTVAVAALGVGAMVQQVGDPVSKAHDGPRVVLAWRSQDADALRPIVEETGKSRRVSPVDSRWPAQTRLALGRSPPRGCRCAACQSSPRSLHKAPRTARATTAHARPSRLGVPVQPCSRFPPWRRPFHFSSAGRGSQASPVPLGARERRHEARPI
jgi:hypothetical protein